MAMQNKAGVTNTDKTLADYIRRVQRLDNSRIPEPNLNDYKVYPEQQGDADHKINPYSPA
jgi:hypothetical protein